MPREKESYRDNLERIKEMYPDKEMLSLQEVAAFIGINWRTAKKMFSFNTFNYISVAVLAREMS
jgi:hypothetical protein